MGYLRTYAFVCLTCRKSFKRYCPIDENVDKLACPHCGKVSYNFGRNFHTPKTSDSAQWEKIEFLFNNGFRFQKIYNASYQTIPYPKTLDEAKDFVKKYKDKIS